MVCFLYKNRCYSKIDAVGCRIMQSVFKYKWYIFATVNEQELEYITD